MANVLAVLAVTVTVLWIVTLYRLIGRDETERQKIAALRRSLDAAGDAAESAQEELAASTALVQMMQLRISDLQETNLQQQVKIDSQRQVIKELSPYQAIRSQMPWGKN